MESESNQELLLKWTSNKNYSKERKKVTLCLFKAKIHQEDITIINIHLSSPDALDLIKTNTTHCKVTDYDDWY